MPTTTATAAHRPHFPLPILTNNAGLILAAAQTHAEISARLPDTYLADTVVVLSKVTGDTAGQKAKKGELGTLTAAQATNLETLKFWMNQARKTASLAFKGQTVKLHEQFQVGVTGPFDLDSVLGRADILLASVQAPANLAALKLRGWTDGETKAFADARGLFGPAQVTRQAAKGGAKDSTTQKNADAAELYERILTIQNAADLQWPPLNPANAGTRDEFRLNTFPPTNSASPATPPPPPALPTPPAK